MLPAMILACSMLLLLACKAHSSSKDCWYGVLAGQLQPASVDATWERHTEDAAHMFTCSLEDIMHTSFNAHALSIRSGLQLAWASCHACTTPPVHHAHLVRLHDTTPAVHKLALQCHELVIRCFCAGSAATSSSSATCQTSPAWPSWLPTALQSQAAAAMQPRCAPQPPRTGTITSCKQDAVAAAPVSRLAAGGISYQLHGAHGLRCLVHEGSERNDAGLSCSRGHSTCLCPRLSSPCSSAPHCCPA